ncbi:type I-E CRISPR-associated protein Cse1/CasA [Streptomonospora sp. S1-112]|uniref:Type I-E CRISPR-associated protein Cse1/CasA n=1 Tax=Streptomonospora mangrovi TaxID=2883123 RepID=A0A9X3NP97_9ACTN|nr:type I-E CRISPR-associated protein Cse1/CasA [Streptomonospora mangrovi]MDA0564155.1 type I-E CRISPR-associated protein Cse1/CasA [Streptomonospora mangrovi]
MPPPAFDLVSQPWIPVRWHAESAADQRPRAVGLAELFSRAHEIAGIDLPLPPAESGLMRLLYAMTAQITGLIDIADHDDFHDAREELLETGALPADAVAAYFAATHRCFDLFDARRPFLQDPRLVEECRDSKGAPVTSGVNKLVWGRVAGNTQMWLSHDSDARPRPVPAAEAAWHLIAWLYYGPSGMSTPRVVGDTSARNTTAGPLRSTISYHPMGDTLLETLLLGVPVCDDGPGGPAPWERTDLPDPLGLPEAPTGLMRLLCGRFRHALLLTPSADGSEVIDARITWAWRQPHAPAEDPYLIYQHSKKGDRYARRADADRAIWRDVDAMLREKPGHNGERRPVVIDNLAELAESTAFGERLDRIRVRALGFDQEGQARDRQYVAAATPRVLCFLKERQHDRFTRIGALVSNAEEVGANLRKALTRAWRDIVKSSDAPVPWLATGLARYWSQAERRFWEAARAEQPPAHPRNLFIRTALAAYAQATDAYTRDPRHVEAIERARTLVLLGWRREDDRPDQ